MDSSGCNSLYTWRSLTTRECYVTLYWPCPPTQLYVLQCDDERILYGLLSDDIPFLFGCAWRAMVSAAAAEGALVLKV